MLKFFRNIRQKLLSENKVRKYLVYAVGEIILVVIGIFIAIQLNDWNQQRMEQKALAVTLQNLQEEFGRTQELLHLIASDYQSSLDANRALLQLFKQNPEDISARKVDTLLGKATSQAPFYPPQPVLDEMMTSGTIKSLSSETLKRLLFEWQSHIQWFHLDYDLMLKFSSNEYNPYINRHWPWRNIDQTGVGESFTEISAFSPGPEVLFGELEFENLVENNLFHTDRLFRRLKQVDTLISHIQQQISINSGHGE